MNEDPDKLNEQAQPEVAENEPPEYPNQPVQVFELPTRPSFEPTKQASGKNIKKKLILLVVAAVVFIALVAGFFVFAAKKDVPPSSNNNQQETTDTDQSDNVSPSSLPDNVVYANRENNDAPYKIYTRPAAGGDRTESLTLPKDVYIPDSIVYGQQVAFAASSSLETDTPLAIWYSKDSGKTFEKVFEDSHQESENIGTQITSLVFSTDGKSLIAGILPEKGDNLVTEIDPATKKSKELFTLSQPGVFLQGYDREKQQAIYFAGCFNCDGGSFDKLLLYDVQKKAASTLYKSEVRYLSTAVKRDFTEVFLAKGTVDPDTEDELGGGIAAPYTLLKLKIADKTTEEVGISSKDVLGVGYTNALTPYYYTPKQVVLMGEKPIFYYETSQPLNHDGVYFVGDASVVTASGTEDNFVLNSYSTTEKSVKKLMDYDTNTNILGVTTKLAN